MQISIVLIAVMTISAVTFSCGHRAEINARTTGTAPDASGSISEDSTATSSPEKNSQDLSAATETPINDVPSETASVAPLRIAPAAISGEFRSGTLMDIASEFSLNHTVISTNYTLARESTSVATESQFNQATRTTYTKQFTQGRIGAPQVENFTDAAAEALSHTLSKPADAGSVTVTVNSLNWPDYEVSGDMTVNFTVPIPVGGSVEIRYTSGALPLLDSFDLGAVPDPQTIRIKVDGLDVNSSNFNLEMGTRIKFGARPADDSEIVVTYKEIAAFSKSFIVTAGAVPASVKLFVNASERTGTYDAVTGEIQFTDAPEEGSVVLIKYQVVTMGNPITKFQLLPPTGGVKDLKGFDTNTLAPVVVSYADNFLTVDPSYFISGRGITVTYLDESTIKYGYTISADPVATSISVTLLLEDGKSRICLPADFAIAGRMVTLTGNLDDVKKIVIGSKTEIGAHSTFSLDEVKDPDNASWSVWINEVLSVNFSRTGSTIKITKALPAAARILIKARVK
jgi:hypothetical protein